MKRFVLILVFVLMLIVVGLGYFDHYYSNMECEEPQRVGQVPASALWIGGCDGGYWIDFVGQKDDRCRFRFYHDWSGDLLMDADFVREGDDQSIYLTKENWKEHFVDYNEYNDTFPSVLIKAHDGAECELKISFPAYGGDDWEILKEKYDLGF
jgi:hypothetical protein